MITAVSGSSRWRLPFKKHFYCHKRNQQRDQRWHKRRDLGEYCKVIWRFGLHNYYVKNSDQTFSLLRSVFITFKLIEKCLEVITSVEKRLVMTKLVVNWNYFGRRMKCKVTVYFSLQNMKNFFVTVILFVTRCSVKWPLYAWSPS